MVIIWPCQGRDGGSIPLCCSNNRVSAAVGEAGQTVNLLLIAE